MIINGEISQAHLKARVVTYIYLKIGESKVVRHHINVKNVTKS